MADTRPTPPTPPTGLPEDLLASLEACSSTELRDVARYAEALAEYHERERRIAAAEDDQDDEQGRTSDQSDGRPGEVPDDVPSKASLTVKEINDNRYYYWQWREGDSVRSQYERPVDPDE